MFFRGYGFSTVSKEDQNKREQGKEGKGWKVWAMMRRHPGVQVGCTQGSHSISWWGTSLITLGCVNELAPIPVSLPASSLLSMPHSGIGICPVLPSLFACSQELWMFPTCKKTVSKKLLSYTNMSLSDTPPLCPALSGWWLLYPLRSVLGVAWEGAASSCVQLSGITPCLTFKLCFHFSNTELSCLTLVWLVQSQCPGMESCSISGTIPGYGWGP
jgi:hypothetical protein